MLACNFKGNKEKDAYSKSIHIITACMHHTLACCALATCRNYMYALLYFLWNYMPTWGRHRALIQPLPIITPRCRYMLLYDTHPHLRHLGWKKRRTHPHLGGLLGLIVSVFLAWMGHSLGTLAKKPTMCHTYYALISFFLSLFLLVGGRRLMNSELKVSHTSNYDLHAYCDLTFFFAVHTSTPI